MRRFFDPLAAAVLSLFSAADFLASEAEKQLFARHPVFGDIVSQVTRTMVLLPPSGAVAGVYAAVDRTRGVWKAPANVSLADVSGVAVKVNDQIQEDLNVTSTGKSVNAIRAFAGKGSSDLGRAHARRQRQRMALRAGAALLQHGRGIDQEGDRAVRLRAQRSRHVGARAGDDRELPDRAVAAGRAGRRGAGSRRFSSRWASARR